MAAAEEELAYEHTAFANHYRRYRARTGMFVPMPPAREGDDGRSLIGRSPLVIATVITAVLLLCGVLVYDAFRAAAAWPPRSNADAPHRVGRYHYEIFHSLPRVSGRTVQTTETIPGRQARTGSGPRPRTAEPSVVGSTLAPFPAAESPFPRTPAG